MQRWRRKSSMIVHENKIPIGAQEHRQQSENVASHCLIQTCNGLQLLSLGCVFKVLFQLKNRWLFVAQRKIRCLYDRIAFLTTMNSMCVNLWTAFLTIINSMLVELPTTIFCYSIPFTVSDVSFPKNKKWKLFTIPRNTCITWSNLSGEQWLHHDHCWQSILVYSCIAFPTTSCGLSKLDTVS